MMAAAAERIAIAGAGIAGLTAAIAFAQRGFPVIVFERAEVLQEIGAGLQLSPNATRILKRLGVLDRLAATAVRPEAIVLRRAHTLRQLASVPLGAEAEQRWHAPYVTIHRADLHSALAATAGTHPLIELRTGTALREVRTGATIRLVVEQDGTTEEEQFSLVVGADGVWSTLRNSVPGAQPSRYSGFMAWRSMLDTRNAASPWLPPTDRVTAFLHPRFHLVAYPVRGQSALNLVAVTRSPDSARGWSNTGDLARLQRAMRGAAGELLALVAAAGVWTTWPLHGVNPSGPWSDPSGLVLIGDAAHAMTPFAAQGAGMAIEDAVVLAHMVERNRDDIPQALRRYETMRQRRVARVVKRGSFNRFAWHASGPIAFGRDLVLARRSAAALAADMDWLYGWDPDTVMPPRQ